MEVIRKPSFEQEKKIKKIKVNSVKKLCWSKKPIKESEVMELINKYKINNIYGTILNARGVNTKNFEQFINPQLKFLLPNPFKIEQMQEASEYIVSCISKEKKVGIIGDYDVDGISSTSILINFFNEIDIECEFYIPNRLKDGYGPSLKAFKYLEQKSCELIFTVDCGTNAASEISKVKNKNLDIIVIDHHLQNDRLPNVFAILNPNKKTDGSNFNNLCAAGVVFFLLVAIKGKLEKTKKFQGNKINLLKFLDLVALATVCDVVKLDEINRLLVKQGLKVINQTRNLGLLSLLKFCSSREMITEYHLGFEIGPRINADGRVGSSSLGVNLLTVTNNNETDAIAMKLDELNSFRKKVEKDVLVKANGIIKSNKSEIICIHSPEWHPGVIGIVASRITDRFICPTVVISESELICKGSCRSVEGFNIGKLIFNAVEEGILVTGGGHKMAAGFSIEKKKINTFKKFIANKYLVNDLPMTKHYDCEILLSQINSEFLLNQNILSPFGQGNPVPKYLIKNCFINFLKIVGDGHLTCTIEDFYGNNFKSIIFGAVDSGVFEYIQDFGGGGVDVIARVKQKLWNNHQIIELQIEDVILI